MKRIAKIRGVVATLVVALSFSTVASAKQVSKVEQKNSKSEKMLKQEKELKQLKELKEKELKEKQLKQKNDRSIKELEKINNKLDRIEIDIKSISERIDKYFSDNVEEQEIENNQEVENQGAVNQEEETQEVESEEVINEEEETQAIENEETVNSEVQEEITESVEAEAKEESEIIEEEGTENQQIENVTEESEEVTNGESEEVTSEEVESSESEEEESISGYSFIGKLNALNNRLDAVKKQMNSPSGKLDKTSPEYAETMDRIAKLKKDISDNVEKLKDFQSPVLKKLKNKIEEQREYTPKDKAVETNKVWTIKFNKNLKVESLSGLNIFVVDSTDTLIETKVSIDKKTGAIKIIPIENYIKGEKYTLFISKDIKSDNGEMLEQATRVPFEIK
jgi:chromosome segregation ATPase